MDVWVIEKPLVPRVQHGGERDPRSQPPPGNLKQCLGDSIEEQAESEGGGPTEERMQRYGQGEDGMEVRHRQ
jgi:hypothetical protein